MTEQPPDRYRPRNATHNLEPLLEHTNATNLHELAITLHISHRWARELQATGLTDTQADRFACRIGLHPSMVWTDWWDIEPDIDEGPDGIMRAGAS